jgi:hypothetical protein
MLLSKDKLFKATSGKLQATRHAKALQLVA